MKICINCNSEFENDATVCPKDGGALEEDLLVGTVLDGQYEIESRLGRGGMGIVYRARHTLLRERRAIKVLSPELIHISGIKERFIREGQAAQRIHHPNSVTVYDLRLLGD